LSIVLGSGIKSDFTITHRLLPINKDDYVCSYFKSGINRMMQFAHDIANQGEDELTTLSMSCLARLSVT
jgi:hypothetical protein